MGWRTFLSLIAILSKSSVTKPLLFKRGSNSLSCLLFLPFFDFLPNICLSSLQWANNYQPRPSPPPYPLSLCEGSLSAQCLLSPQRLACPQPGRRQQLTSSLQPCNWGQRWTDRTRIHLHSLGGALGVLSRMDDLYFYFPAHLLTLIGCFDKCVDAVRHLLISSTV